MKSNRVDPGWHEKYFGDDWLRIALHVTNVQTSAEVAFIMSALELSPGMAVLDMPCGHGRHSLELASHGLRVTGVDSSPESVRIARATSSQRGLGKAACFRDADMRHFTAESPVDAAIVMQTSFGFMENEEEDLQILRNIRESLAPGGRLLLDVVSIFRLARTMLVPRRWERLDDGTVHIEDRRYDFQRGRRDVTVELFTPGGEHRKMSHSIRIYSLPELSAMLGRAGYRVIGTFGGYDAQPYGFDSKRLIVLSQRVD
jgi:cyclopropane fatty-acyl-phospholipid synthase-like methyltransferase